ncbi:MAG: sigma-70 family RNA polymerase sigma factor [Porphyromonadaceae bacterium]|jgi:RNA polymerase sigma-70 factor (ECF subfamily)|nr:sigma-70 family RNA polymerase sigma factor [uncultured Macellibacteroides sp.]MCE5225342.1 sigma-70 family RNA polymerase sigma factor [Porphyromonadaceae bacterium]
MYNNAQTDLEIWQSFLEGNEHALEEIYRGQYSRLYAYGIKFVADKELVKDCIQDLFVKLHCNRKQLRETVNLNTYLIRALKNKLYDSLSAHIDMQDIDALPFDLKAEDSFFTLFSENDEDLLQKHKLQKALEKISPRQRESIYLRFIQELDYEEIGTILEINYQSAKNLVSRTLIKLREIYFES